jgi:L-aspartate oxidase
MTTDEVDVLVVGSGVAGLSVALGLAGARRVLVLSKGDGSTVWAQGGIAAAVDAADSPDDHALDTAVAGAGLCDEAGVRCLTEEGPSRVAELITLGAQFDRGANGALSRTLEGGHHHHRVVHAGGDATGAEVSHVLMHAAKSAGVDILADATVRQLTRDRQGTVTGAIVDLDGDRVTIAARAVVLATGGIGNAYESSTNPASVTGDGIALALQAGAELVDMEFVQFHPTVLFTNQSQRGQLSLVSEAVRGEGAVLIDGSGRPIMAGKHPLADLAPRDIVAREIDSVLTRDGASHVWLDASAIPAATLHQRFPNILAACERAGIDATVAPIPVAPAEHFLCGGIRTDRWGATSVPGLYAVGETAATGVHGANRLASNSLLEGLVFGRRVAARLVLDFPERAGPIAAQELPDLSAAQGSHDDARARTILSRHAGVRRSGAGLAAAADQLAHLSGTIATTARAVLTAAQARHESRGCHWRSDYPDASGQPTYRIVLTMDETGRIVPARHRIGPVA